MAETPKNQDSGAFGGARSSSNHDPSARKRVNGPLSYISEQSCKIMNPMAIYNPELETCKFTLSEKDIEIPVRVDNRQINDPDKE